MIKKIIKIIIFLVFFSNSLMAKTEYFNEGLTLFKNNKFNEAKFKFEQDIVFNPKNEKSYLYLSKVFKILEKRNLEEQNLNTVILLNPKNEEAIYNLAKLKLATSDYKKSKELNNILNSLCVEFCSQSQKLEIDIENLSKK
jgi:tetratricopeptide (TPR) repeat protein